MAAPTTATAAAEYIAEYIAEDVTEIGRAMTGLSFYTSMTILVIASALLLVGEHLEGFVSLLENFDSLFVARILVWVILHSHAAIGLLDIGRRCVSGDAQHFIVILL